MCRGQVKTITEQLCGFEVTSSQVSRATSELDEHYLHEHYLHEHYLHEHYLHEHYLQWRERPLGPALGPH